MDVMQKVEAKSKAGRKKKAIVFDDYGMEIKAEPSKVYSFRVPTSVAKMWDAKIRESGMDRSKFFRKAVEENKTVVKAAPPLHPYVRQILHLLEKQGNNVNQLAHRANTSQLAGTLDNNLYRAILIELKEINDKSTQVMYEVM